MFATWFAVTKLKIYLMQIRWKGLRLSYANIWTRFITFIEVASMLVYMIYRMYKFQNDQFEITSWDKNQIAFNEMILLLRSLDFIGLIPSFSHLIYMLKKTMVDISSFVMLLFLFLLIFSDIKMLNIIGNDPE